LEAADRRLAQELAYGVLRLRVLKAETARPRTIEVKVK